MTADKDRPDQSTQPESQPQAQAGPEAPGRAAPPFGGFAAAFLLAGIIGITLNLRGAITGVGPLLGQIQAETGISSGVAGLLTTLPLFAFAFISPLASPLALRLGMERSLFAAIIVLAAGLVLRAYGAVPALFIGTALVGTGIAIGNVLVPGLIRRDFETNLAFVTALFTAVMVLVGGVGSGIAVPLSEIGGWRFSLMAWVTPAVLAMILWLPQLRNATRPSAAAAHVPKIGKVWGAALAWQVTLFMGVQASAFYVLITWLPGILAEQGIGAARAGWILFLLQGAILAATMVVPVFIKKSQSQSLIGVVCGLLVLIGYAGLLVSREAAILWMVIAGFGSGGSLVLALTLFSLRASNPEQTVALSGMAQSVGYLLAALVPVGIGVLRDLTGSWTAPLIAMVALAVVHCVLGALAGRPLQLRTD